MIMQQNPISIFISYAHEDESWLQELLKHLNPLKQQGLISTWYDRQIVPGTNWAKEIDQRLEEASLILLLVSTDFLASEYCYEIELKRALARHKAGQARVIPIVVRPVDWQGALFAHLQALPTDARAITSWSNLDEAFADVVAGMRRTIEDLSLLPASASHAALPPIWNIPYPRNSFFTGRDTFLSQLHMQLQAGQATALSQEPQAISGLGGIGKTQIAVEYAYRYAQNYEVVLWARAESQEALYFSYTAIAKLLKLAARQADEQEVIIEAVKAWLQAHRNWLLILDNADDLDLLPPFLPSTFQGHILITTRAWDMQRLATRLEVETFSTERGALFLLRRAGLLASDAELARASSEDRRLAKQLTQELGGLPLALDQAGAYLEATGPDLDAYLRLYQEHQRERLQERRSRIGDHPDPVATTWLLSFERVEKKYPQAAELLRLCAYLAPDSIPEEIFTRGASHLGPLLEPVAADPVQFAQAIEALRTYSFVQRDLRMRTLSVHRLVQAVVRESLTKQTEQDWKERVVLALAAANPNIADTNQWEACERWLPHALVGALWIEQEQMSNPAAASMLNAAGSYLTVRARYRKAEPLLQRALAIRQLHLGTEHLDTAESLNNLAELYLSQGKYAPAEELYQKALTVRELHLGPGHPGTAESLRSLAKLYTEWGKYARAESLFVRALAIREQQLGPDHPDTAATLNNLAELYLKQGKYAPAEPLYQRALAIREQQLGPNHLYTADSLNSFALFYYRQRKYQKAEQFYLRALSILEQQLGPDHPSTAMGLNNLALLYYDRSTFKAPLLNQLIMAFLYRLQGKYKQAESLFQRALASNEEQLGPDHPGTALCLNNLALLYYDWGKYAQAEPLHQRALAIHEQQLGPEHLDTANSLNNLALLYFQSGSYYNRDRFAKATPLFQRALAIYEQQLGSKHPDTQRVRMNYNASVNAQKLGSVLEAPLNRILGIWTRILGLFLGSSHPRTAQSLNNLALFYHDQQRYEEAEPLYQRVLAIREKRLGASHPDTMTSLTNLAFFYQTQKKYAEAEPLYQRILAIREQQSGAWHPDTARSLNDLAFLYELQKKYAEAVPLYQRELAIRERQPGKEQHSMALTLMSLARIYCSQEKYAEAEPLYQRSLAIREQQLGEWHLLTAESLGLLYELQGKYAEAVSLYRRILKLYEERLGAEHPDTLTSMDNLTKLQKRQSDNARTLADYDQILLLDPKNVLAYSRRGNIYFNQGDYVRALADYDQVLLLDPENATADKLRRMLVDKFGL